MKVKCPTCKKEVEYDKSQPYRPFCSERCKLIDLGEWASESYRVPVEDQTPSEFNEDEFDPNDDDGGSEPPPFLH